MSDSIKDMVSGAKTVSFGHYREGELWEKPEGRL